MVVVVVFVVVWWWRWVRRAGVEGVWVEMPPTGEWIVAAGASLPVLVATIRRRELGAVPPALDLGCSVATFSLCVGAGLRLPGAGARACVSAATAENIKTLVRVRPPNEREVADGEGVYRKSVEVSGNSLTYEGAKPFTFDACCDEDSTQEQIFELVGKPMTDSCLDGYNGSYSPCRPRTIASRAPFY